MKHASSIAPLRTAFAVVALAIVPALTLTACDLLNPKASTKQGEEPLGKFSFLANAAEDSCLSPLFTGALSFEGTLSRTKSSFYFTTPAGTLEGTIAGKTFSVITGGTESLDQLCALTRDETISGTFSADGITIAGTYLIRQIPVQGSNCYNAVFGPQRIFAQLPCVVRYTLSASQLEAPDAGLPDAGPADAGVVVDGGVTDDGGTTTPADGGATASSDGG